MTIKIGEKIKQLRKQADVNQDKFAEYLGVTAQAVSKWEVGDCYPDIELLPSIANFFNISIDELMCFDIMKKQEKIDRIIEQSGSERSRKWFDGSNIELLRNAIQEFPNNYELLFCLAKALCFIREPYVFPGEEEKRRNLQESISISKRILSNCLDDNLRFRTIQVLARAYKEIGKEEKAIEAASKLPLARNSRDMVLPDILEDEAKQNQLVKNIWFLSDMFEYAIENLANTRYKDDPEIRITLFEKVVSFEEILHENKDYIYENLRLRATYFWLSEDYMKLKDYDNALDCIDKFAEHSIIWDSLPEVSTYTSLIYQGEQCHKRKDFDDMKDTSLGAKKLLLSREIFAPVRGHVRFKAVISKLDDILCKI